MWLSLMYNDTSDQHGYFVLYNCYIVVIVVEEIRSGSFWRDSGHRHRCPSVVALDKESHSVYLYNYSLCIHRFKFLKEYIIVAKLSTCYISIIVYNKIFAVI